MDAGESFQSALQRGPTHAFMSLLTAKRDVTQLLFNL